MKIFAKLSDAGLGNKMFVWIKALICAHQNKAELFHSSWIDFHPKAYLRNITGKQRDWRFYRGIFKRQGILKIIRLQYYKLFYKKIKEPLESSVNINDKSLIVFWDIPRHADFLNDFIPYRNFIKEQIFKNLSSGTYRKYQILPTPLISIHLRKGDLPEHMRTPNEDIIKIIAFLNKRYKTNLPYCLFVDSPPSSVADILQIPNIHIEHTHNPMVDLLHLSKSKVIIPSIISSFSIWACFLSEAIILRHPNDKVSLPLREENKYVDYRFDTSYIVSDDNVLQKLDEIIYQYLECGKIS